MKNLLYGTALAVCLAAAPANAAVIQNLGVNPSSSQGDFSNNVGGGAFTDQYTFQLVGAGSQFVTFASATNVFAQPSDFITGFNGSLFLDLGAPGPGGGDVLVSGPVAAVPCIGNPTGCQVLAGSALLAAGNYFLQIAGIGGGTSGYGGNLTTAAVAIPGPIAGAGLPGLVLAIAGMLGLARRRRNAAA